MTKTEIYDAAELLDEREHLQLITAMWRSHIARYGDPGQERSWYERNKWVDILIVSLASLLLVCILASCTSTVEQTSTALDGTVTVTKRTFKFDGGALGNIIGVSGTSGTYRIPTVTPTK